MRANARVSVCEKARARDASSHRRAAGTRPHLPPSRLLSTRSCVASAILSAGGAASAATILSTSALSTASFSSRSRAQRSASCRCVRSAACASTCADTRKARTTSTAADPSVRFAVSMRSLQARTEASHSRTRSRASSGFSRAQPRDAASAAAVAASVSFSEEVVSTPPTRPGRLRMASTADRSDCVSARR